MNPVAGLSTAISLALKLITAMWRGGVWLVDNMPRIVEELRSKN